MTDELEEGTEFEDLEAADVQESNQELDDPLEETSENDASASEDESPEEVEDKWFVPGTFKTPEDMHNSYKHLQTELNRVRTTARNLETKQQTPTRDAEAENKAFIDEAQTDFVGALRKYSTDNDAVAEAKKITFENRYNYLMESNSEFRELEPTMTAIAEQYSDIISSDALKNNPDTLDLLYHVAKGINGSQKAEEKGKKAGEASAAKKLKAKVEGPSGSKGRTTKKFDEQSQEEMEKQLGIKERF